MKQQNLEMVETLGGILTLYLQVSSAEKPFQTVWTQIRPDKRSGLIWIQTVGHSDGIPERIF